MNFKKLLLVLNLFACNFSHGKTLTPRLVVPDFSREIKVVEDNIFVPAFNMDISMNWPADLQQYSIISAGSEKTTILLKKNNKLFKIGLEEAIQKKYVLMCSISATVYGRNPGLLIEPLSGTTLVSLKTAGFIATDSTNSVLNNINTTKLLTISDGGYDLNATHGPTYLLAQQDIWHFLNDEILNDKEKLNAFTNDLVRYRMIGSGRIPGYYDISTHDQVIYIHVKAVPFEPARPTSVYYNDNGQSNYMLKAMVEDLKQLVVYKQSDSFLVSLYFSAYQQKLDSIIIMGKYKGIIPLEIHFTCEQKIILTGKFLEDQPIMSPKSPYKAGLFLDYDFDDVPGLCRIKLPNIIRYSPAEKNAPNLEACGLVINASISDIHLGL